MSEEKPQIAQRAPFGLELTTGTYWWCACGKSQKQPFCDGSHKGGSFSPTKMEISEAKTYWLCGCKHSAKAPFCDGAHKRLPEEA